MSDGSRFVFNDDIFSACVSSSIMTACISLIFLLICITSIWSVLQAETRSKIDFKFSGRVDFSVLIGDGDTQSIFLY